MRWEFHDIKLLKLKSTYDCIRKCSNNTNTVQTTQTMYCTVQVYLYSCTYSTVYHTTYNVHINLPIRTIYRQVLWSLLEYFYTQIEDWK